MKVKMELLVYYIILVILKYIIRFTGIYGDWSHSKSISYEWKLGSCFSCMYCRYLANSTQIDSQFYIFICILRKKSDNISRSTYNVFEPFKAFSNGSLHLLFNWVKPYRQLLFSSYGIPDRWNSSSLTPYHPRSNAFAFLYFHDLVIVCLISGWIVDVTFHRSFVSVSILGYGSLCSCWLHFFLGEIWQTQKHPLRP